MVAMVGLEPTTTGPGFVNVRTPTLPIELHCHKKGTMPYILC